MEASTSHDRGSDSTSSRGKNQVGVFLQSRAARHDALCTLKVRHSKWPKLPSGKAFGDNAWCAPAPHRDSPRHWARVAPMWRPVPPAFARSGHLGLQRTRGPTAGAL